MTKRFLSLLTANLCALGLSATTAAADFIGVPGPNSIDGSLCVGNDCVANEAFGFDTIRLKENNLRIHFDDTTAAGGFPANDWRLHANASASGGDSYFGIEDATANRFLFRVFAGARENALTVDSQGDLGLGTASPATDIEIVTGNTPTMRLQQDGSASFTPQAWDMGGNEAGFFIRDATSGSTLPFRIISGGAPSQSLVIDDDGDVGVGAGTNPQASLHVRRTDGTAAVLIEEAGGTTAPRGLLTMRNNGIVFFSLEDTSIAAGPNTGREWNFQNQSGTFRVTTAPGGAGDIEMQLDVGGNLTIEGEIITAGSCSAGCDRVFDPDYALPTISEQVAAMYANRHLPNVGPTPEEGPMNLSQKVGGMLNELEKAHIYIGQLHDEITRLRQLEAELGTLRALEVRLEALEARDG